MPTVPRHRQAQEIDCHGEAKKLGFTRSGLTDVKLEVVGQSKTGRSAKSRHFGQSELVVAPTPQ